MSYLKAVFCMESFGISCSGRIRSDLPPLRQPKLASFRYTIPLQALRLRFPGTIRKNDDSPMARLVNFSPFIFFFCIFILSIFTLIEPLRACNNDKFDVIRVEDSNIRLDGKLDEAIWMRLQPIKDWYQLTPNEGDIPSEVTEMSFFYDENSIYLGARLYVKNPATIFTATFERDSFSADQDSIGLIIDTLNDNRTGYGFIISSAGVKTDIAIFDDAETGDKPWNIEWNAFWDAAVSHDEKGWTAELKIPFSSLRYKSIGSRAEMGIIFWRYIARNVEYDTFPAIPNQWGFTAYKPSQALDIVFEKIEPKHPVYLRPYILGGLEQKNVLDIYTYRYQLQNERKRNVGLDLKYNLTSNLVFDVTLNTDFAQVEADDQRINLTRFTLLFPEKRPFFQERADLFDFGIPIGSQKLFHSRSIGIVNGHSIPIIGGVRLTGRIGDWQIGLMDMQTAGAEVEGNKIASENFGIFRFKKEMLNDGSYIGGLITSRVDSQGNYNFVYAADADLSLKPPYAYIKIKFAQSVDLRSPSLESLMAAFVLESRIKRGFSYAFVARHLGSDFRPGIGFLSRGGVSLLDNRLDYTWYPKSSRFLQNHGIQNKVMGIWNSATGRFETLDENIKWEALFRSGAVFQGNLKILQENLIEPFSLGKVTIKPGHHSFAYFDGYYHSPPGVPIQLELQAEAGGFYSGWQTNSTLSPSWIINSYLTLKVDYIYSRIVVEERKYEPKVIRLRIQSAINPKLTAGAFVQYSSDLDCLSANIRFRYNPREGVDLYLVYNEGINTARETQFAALPLTIGRAILIKFNYTFIQ